jgi:hypothetical protein
MDQHLGQSADCQDFNINDFIADGKINGKQIFLVKFAELGTD